MIPAGGAPPTDVAVNEQVVLRGTEVASVSSHPAPNVDAWDRWNRNRTAQLAGAPRNGQYVSSNVAGVDDLARAGAWHETPRYGHVWVPRDVQDD